MRTKHPSDEAFEVWVDGCDRLRTLAIQVAFRGGWDAREQAPNTLILDTTKVQEMTIVPDSSAAAGGLPVHVARAKQSVPIELGGESEHA